MDVVSYRVSIRNINDVNICNWLPHYLHTPEVGVTSTSSRPPNRILMADVHVMGNVKFLRTVTGVQFGVDGSTNRIVEDHWQLCKLYGRWTSPTGRSIITPRQRNM